MVRLSQELPTVPAYYVSLYAGSHFHVFRDSFRVAWRGLPDYVRTLLATRLRGQETGSSTLLVVGSEE